MKILSLITHPHVVFPHNMTLMLQSMQGQKALWFNQTYLNLCSEDEGLTGLKGHEGE